MNPTTTPSNDPVHFDVREISCRDKHAQIFARWTALPVGGHFILVNDHDPVPLYYQFAAQFGDAFTWEYLERGPEEFHVKITRVAETTTPENLRPPTGGGCGHHRSEAKVPVVALDVRGLEPPEPMLQILAVLDVLPSGRELRAQTDRRPIHLLAELDSRGIAHASEEQPDGSWLNVFRKP